MRIMQAESVEPFVEPEIRPFIQVDSTKCTYAIEIGLLQPIGERAAPGNANELLLASQCGCTCVCTCECPCPCTCQCTCPGPF